VTERTNPFQPIYKQLNAGTGEKTSMPLLLDIEPSNCCNFSCLFCLTGMKSLRRKTGFMDESLFRLIIDEAAKYNIAIRFSRWGEPTLHPKFMDFLELTKSKGLLCHFNTNGSLLTEEKMKRILDMKVDSVKFSFQGVDEKTYGEMRYGESFDKLVQTISRFSELRGDKAYPYIHASTTITYESAEMVEKFKKLLSAHCDYVSIGNTNLSSIMSQIDSLPEKYKILLQKLKKEESIEMVHKQCNEVFAKLSINFDGSVTCCCADYDNYMLVGSLNDVGDGLKYIWENSEKLRKYQEMLRAYHFDKLPLCRHCFDTMNLKSAVPDIIPNSLTSPAIT